MAYQIPGTEAFWSVVIFALRPKVLLEQMPLLPQRIQLEIKG